MNNDFIFKKLNNNKNIRERKRSCGLLGSANQHSQFSPI